LVTYRNYTKMDGPKNKKSNTEFSLHTLLLHTYSLHKLAKGRLPLASAQDGHLQRMRIPEAAYMYN